LSGGLPINTGSAEDTTVAVFGAGRSGTTWLAQIIAAAGLELIFEPLWSKEVPEVEDWKPWPLFFRKGDSFPWHGTFSAIMAGEVRNEWIVRQNPGAQRRVIKFIRANLMIDWILENYLIHPVFIIRNPLSAVASMQEQEWYVPEYWIESLLRAPRFVEPFFCNLPGVVDLAQRELTDVEAKAVFWCIQNAIPQQLGCFDRMHMVVYEELCEDPEEVIGSLASKICVPVTDEVRDQLHRRSFMAGKRDGEPGYDPITAWKGVLTEVEADAVEDIVHRFGLAEFLRR